MSKPDMLIHFDGACEPTNPGGIGTWGFVAQSKCALPSFADYGVHGDTNNKAEYAALYKALRWLELARGDDGRDLFGLHVKIMGDSQLVVRQMSGKYKANAPHLIRARDACRQIVASLLGGPIYETIEIEWVPREENEAADALSRRAYEEHTGKKFPERRR